MEGGEFIAKARALRDESKVTPHPLKVVEELEAQDTIPCSIAGRAGRRQ